jgi:hypothetical protein
MSSHAYILLILLGTTCLGDVEANPVDEANAMRAGIKDKSLALRQKLGKLTVVANPELGDRFLAQVIIIDFICVPI